MAIDIANFVAQNFRPQDAAANALGLAQGLTNARSRNALVDQETAWRKAENEQNNALNAAMQSGDLRAANALNPGFTGQYMGNEQAMDVEAIRRFGAAAATVAKSPGSARYLLGSPDIQADAQALGIDLTQFDIENTSPEEIAEVGQMFADAANQYLTGPGEQFTLGADQARYDASGNLIARGPEKQGDDFTLSPGQERRSASGQLIAAAAPDPADIDASALKNLETEEGLRKEFNDLTKSFRQVDVAYSKIQAASQNPDAAGDLALIFNYMKMLDPGSTVREGEFANAQNAAGVEGRVVSMYNNVLRGERLNAEQRGQFVSRAGELYNSEFEAANAQAEAYRGIAQKAGVDADSVLATLSGKRRAESSGGGNQAPDGTVIRNAQGQTFVKQNGQWVPQ